MMGWLQPVDAAVIASTSRMILIFIGLVIVEQGIKRGDSPAERVAIPINVLGRLRVSRVSCLSCFHCFCFFPGDPGGLAFTGSTSYHGNPLETLQRFFGYSRALAGTPQTPGAPEGRSPVRLMSEAGGVILDPGHLRIVGRCYARKVDASAHGRVCARFTPRWGSP